jgi:hypothetical protein
MQWTARNEVKAEAERSLQGTEQLPVDALLPKAPNIFCIKKRG